MLRTRALGLAIGGVLVAGCLARAQGFQGFASHWTVELSDRTASVTAIHVLEPITAAASAPAGIAPAVVPAAIDLPSEPSVVVRNVAAAVVEVSWLGGPCLEAASFSLAAARGDTLDLRYDIGPPCEEDPALLGYAFEIRFSHPVDAHAITTVPSWGP